MTISARVIIHTVIYILVSQPITIMPHISTYKITQIHSRVSVRVSHATNYLLTIVAGDEHLSLSFVRVLINTKSFSFEKMNNKTALRVV